jgi:hypothetical protein
MSSIVAPWKRIYNSLTVTTVHIKSSLDRLTLNLQLNYDWAGNSKSKSHCDWRSISKSWCQAPSGAHDQIFMTLRQLRFCFCRAPSLTTGRVCLLYMLLTLASVVFLGSVSLGSRDHISLFVASYDSQGHGGGIQVKVKVTLRLTVSQSVSKSWRRDPSGAHDHIIYYSLTVTVFFFVGRPLWREDGSVFYICCWPSPA